MKKMKRQGICVALTIALAVCGCEKKPRLKPDLTKGTVTGIVLCADTGKPARFANVTLSAAPDENTKRGEGEALPDTEETVTGLDGRFTMEAVPPGQYYAFATLNGYLDPARGVDLERAGEKATDKEQEQDAIDQWRDHLVAVKVAVHRTSEISIPIERGAEIDGAVTYDDGSPAIGMHFEVLRKRDKASFTNVGIRLFNNWNVEEKSDSHGRFAIGNLPPGEYTVCAALPSDTEEAALRICLGDTLRKKSAKTIKVAAGEIATGTDITIPLEGLHTVAGTISHAIGGQAASEGKVHLLFADDREQAMETGIEPDGSFEFDYVPEGKYIVRVTDAKYRTEVTPAANDGGNETAATRPLDAKEIPVMVQDDVQDLSIALSEPGPSGTPQLAPQQ